MSSYSTAAFSAARAFRSQPASRRYGSNGAELVGALQEADATGAGPVEQGRGGHDNVRMDMIGSAAGQAERRLVDVARQVDLDCDGLAGDQFVEAAKLVHHCLELLEHGLRVVVLAAGDAHRQGRIRRRGPELRQLDQRGQEGGPRDPQEISAIATRSHGCSPWFGRGSGRMR